MAEDIRNRNPDDGGLGDIRRALIRECQDEEESCLYTSTTFFIWLRWLKSFRVFLWAAGGIGSVVAASHILKGDSEQYRIWVAAAALAGVLFPALIGVTTRFVQNRTLTDLSDRACLWQRF